MNTDIKRKARRGQTGGLGNGREYRLKPSQYTTTPKQLQPPTSDDPHGLAYDLARAAGDDDDAAAAWQPWLDDYTQRNGLVIPATGPQEAALEALQRFLKRAAIEAIKAELGIEGPGIYGLSSQDARRLIDAATVAKKQLIETWRKARAGRGE